MPALRIAHRAYVADPFFPSKSLVGLLDVRAHRLRQESLGTSEHARARLGVASTSDCRIVCAIHVFTEAACFEGWDSVHRR